MNKAIVTAIAAGMLTLVSNAVAAPPDVVTSPNTQVTRLNDRDLMVQASDEKAELTLHFEGADRLSYGDAGELEITWTNGNRTRYRPDVFQKQNGKFKPVVLGYRITGKDRVTVEFHKYNKDLPILMRRGSATL